MIRFLDDPIGKTLPIQQGLCFKPFHPFETSVSGPSGIFGKIYDNGESPLAVIRECHYDTVAAGLKELKFLEKSGVLVARHLAFTGPNESSLLLVEHVEGERGPMEGIVADPEKLLELGTNVIKYALGAISEKRPVLEEIAQPFQYIFRDGEYVLVDLDMVLSANTGEDADKLAAYNTILDIEGSYIQVLSPNSWEELDGHLNPLRQIAADYEPPFE